MVDLILLKIQDFDVILGMDWLRIYHSNANYHTKVVSLRTLDGKEVKFKGERNEEYEGLVLTLTARKLVRKRGEVYLVYVIDKKSEEMRLSKIPIAQEFPKVFPEDLLGLPPGQEVEVSIEVFPGTTLVSQTP